MYIRTDTLLNLPATLAAMLSDQIVIIVTQMERRAA